MNEVWLVRGAGRKLHVRREPAGQGRTEAELVFQVSFLWDRYLQCTQYRH